MSKYEQEDISKYDDALGSGDLMDLFFDLLDHLNLKLVKEDQYGNIVYKIVNVDDE